MANQKEVSPAVAAIVIIIAVVIVVAIGFYFTKPGTQKISPDSTTAMPSPVEPPGPGSVPAPGGADGPAIPPSTGR